MDTAETKPRALAAKKRSVAGFMLRDVAKNLSSR
jgi:hypothetical protein